MKNYLSSILSNSCNKKMQEISNKKVKHRGKFRPFAPVVCEDGALTVKILATTTGLLTSGMLPSVGSLVSSGGS